MTTRTSKYAGRSLMLIRVGGVALLIGVLGNRVGLIGLGLAFGLFGVGFLLSGVALVMALVTLLVGRRTPEVARRAGIALVLAVAVVAIPVSTILSGGSAPAIHHITTDTQDPPQFDAVIALRGDTSNSLEYTADIAGAQRRAYPDIQPLFVQSPPDEVFDRSEQVVRGLGWEVVNADRAAGRIEATDTTFWFGFKDDVVVRIRPADNGSRVDLRSVSRVGGGDIGANAARIRAFSSRLTSPGS